MCGIAGFCLAPGERGLPFPADIASALLLQIMERGTDATGVAWTDRKFQSIRLRKDDCDAADFILQGDAESIRDTATVCILHTRLATQGSPQQNVNNHPIKSGHVVGVHNGVLDNDDELFAELRAPRKGKVDSEAAFALLSYGKGRTTDLLERIEGRAALAWIDRRDTTPILHLARAYGSPLAVGQSEGGSLFFASTMTLLERAMDSLGIELTWTLDLAEGVYMTVKDGQVLEYQEFKAQAPSYTRWWDKEGRGTVSAVLGPKGKGKGRKPGNGKSLPKIGQSGRPYSVPRSGSVTPYDMAFTEDDGWVWDEDQMVYVDKEAESIVDVHRMTDDEFQKEMSDLGISE